MDTSERFEKLEKRLKRTELYNRLLLAVVLLAGLVMAVGATKDKKVVEASEFRLVDEKGQTRAAMSLDKEGNSLLGFLGDIGQTRAAVGIFHHGPGLILADENGIGSVQLYADKPRLVLEDEKGNCRVALSLRSDGPRLSLYDKNKKHRVTLGSTHAGTPDGKTITYPESSLILFDPNGEVIWQAP